MSRIISPFALVAASLLAGCGGGTQYCATPSRANPETCIEFNIVGALGPAGLAGGLYVSALCEVIGADAAAGSCPSEGRVGGCQEESDGDVDIKAISWTYTGTLDELACDGDEIKLDGNGDPVSAGSDTDTGGAPSECSEAGGGLAAVNTTFDNQTGSLGTLYWVDSNCTETRYALVDAGGTHTQDTFAGHVWILRAGDNDATGTLLWEGKLTAADDQSTVTMD